MPQKKLQRQRLARLEAKDKELIQRAIRLAPPHLLRLYGRPKILSGIIRARGLDGRHYRHEFKARVCWRVRLPGGGDLYIPVKGKLWGTVKSREGFWLL